MEKEEKTRHIRPEISDDEAVAIITTNATAVNHQFIATKFVPRTILYPVAIEYQPGVFTKEIRAAVTQHSYCSPADWERALELEKKYKKLNDEYKKALIAKKVPVDVKEPGNPLKTTYIEFN